MPETPSSEDSTSTKLQRIAARAIENRETSFTSLAHLIDVEALSNAFNRVRKSSAAGVDGVTWATYAQDLKGNLTALHARLVKDTYKAPPVRRVYIPKGDGRQRPIGIPTLEDKIVQRAYVTVLETIYEQDFYDCSYGFRPGRGCHDALEALRNGCMDLGVGWVLDADIEGFFDNLDHHHLRDFIGRRVSDGPMRRMINRWLKAGVLDGRQLLLPDSGTPQGGVISPLLANIYLHYVLDEWFHETVLERMRGRVFLIRYADDFVIGFERKDDADRVMGVLPQRFAKYGLRLHPEKTRLVRFEKPPHQDRPNGPQRPGTFDFLGLTHYWGRSKKGYWVVKQKTSKKSMARAVRSIRDWCRSQRHQPLDWQYRKLRQKLLGHYAYYGVTGNIRQLRAYYGKVRHHWRKWLGRRSNKAHLTAKKYNRMLKHRFPLPEPKVVHSIYRSATGIVNR